MKVTRRHFSRMVAASAATAVAPLGLLQSRLAFAEAGCSPASFSTRGFGPLTAMLPLNTRELGDLAGLDAFGGDLRNIPLLRLPRGFQYTAVSIRGQVMTDGNLVPGDHDGMAAFSAPGGVAALVRNHELSIIENEAGSIVGCRTANGQQYDPWTGEAAGLGGGGTSTVIVDAMGRVVQDFVSLGGTIRNCAGGPTPWGSWISCEENVSTPANQPLATLPHGYNFEVPSQLREGVVAVPLVAMGRMNHEAVSVDPRDGYVYETEDRGDSAWYRFIPAAGVPTKFGDLQQGGVLDAIVIDMGQTADCDGSPLPITEVNGTAVVDTRGTARGASGSMLPFLGQKLSASWVRLEDVDPVEDTLRFEAQAKGASLWWRGEGAWYADGKHYWVCSGAGDAGEGQVWCYDPLDSTVTLIVESTSEDLLDGPDNMTVGVDGTLYLCEDGSSGDIDEAKFSQRVVGVAANGGLFDFCQNIIPGDQSEFAGACFSPNQRYMFVNNQGLGITYVIWRENGRRIILPSQ